jgi:hypothetical protein
MAFAISVRTASLAWCFLAIMCLAYPALASQTATDQEKVVEAVRLMYVAATNDDLAQFRAVTSPDFYAFDGGKRMTGDELMGFVKNAHAAGKIYVWQVTEPQVYVDGATAWITYVNRGSLQDSAGKKDLSWLESAVLRKDNDTWRIHFFHSTRVPSE